MVSRGVLGLGSVWVLLFCWLGMGCTTIDNVGGGDSLPAPPLAPVLDESIPTQVDACDTPGCQNILLISGTKAARSGVVLDTGAIAAPVSEVTTFSFDFELTEPSNRVAVRSFDQDNQTSDWVYLDITLISAEDPGEEGTDPTNPTTGVDTGLVDLTIEADAFSSLHPKIAMGLNNEPIAVWQSCGGADACDRPRILVSRKLSPTLWATPTVVSSDDIGSANALSPDVTVDGQGLIHIVWVDDGSVGFRGGVSDIIYRTWDGTVGGGLSEPETITRNHIPSNMPVDSAAISAWGDMVRATYMARSGSSAQREYEVFEATQQPDAAWTLSQVSSNVFDEGAGHSGATHPDIVVDKDGHSHIVWQNARKLNADFTDRMDIHYFVTGASGPWVVNEPCDSTEDRNVHSPSLAVDPYDEQNRVYVSWVADGGCRADGQARSIHLAYTEGAMGAFEVFTNPVTDFVQFGSNTNRSPVVSLITSSEIPIAERYVVVGFVTGAALGDSGDDDDVVIRKLSRSGSPVGTIGVVSEPVPGQDTSLEKSREPSCAIGSNAEAHCLWQEWDGAETGADYDIVYGVMIP